MRVKVRVRVRVRVRGRGRVTNPDPNPSPNQATRCLGDEQLRARFAVGAHVRRDVVRGGEQRAVELDHGNHACVVRGGGC